MNDITQRVSDALATPIENSGFSRRMARDVARAVDAQAARGIVQAARAQAEAYVADTRIRAGAFVTRTALTCAAELSAYEEQCIRQAPLGQRRYELLADTFAAFAASEIANLGKP